MLVASCVHSPEMDAEVERGVAAAVTPYKRPLVGAPRIIGSAALEHAYCPPPRSQLTWDQMLDCADYEDSSGDPKVAAALWVRVATMGVTPAQRCLALSRLELRTDGRLLGLVPPSTMTECQAAFQAQADRCSATCTLELAACRQRQLEQTPNRITSAEMALLARGLTDDVILTERPDFPRCGEEFTACYRSCTIVR